MPDSQPPPLGRAPPGAAAGGQGVRRVVLSRAASSNRLDRLAGRASRRSTGARSRVGLDRVVPYSHPRPSVCSLRTQAAADLLGELAVVFPVEVTRASVVRCHGAATFVPAAVLTPRRSRPEQKTHTRLPVSNVRGASARHGLDCPPLLCNGAARPCCRGYVHRPFPPPLPSLPPPASQCSLFVGWCAQCTAGRATKRTVWSTSSSA